MATDDDQGEDGQENTADQTADLLEDGDLGDLFVSKIPDDGLLATLWEFLSYFCLFGLDDLFSLGLRILNDASVPGKNLGQLLDGAKGDAVAGCKEDGRDDGRTGQSRREKFRDARTLESPGEFLFLPLGRLRQERTNQDQWKRGDHPRDQRVSPSFMLSIDRWKPLLLSEPSCQDGRQADQESADRREGLGVS